MTSPEMWIETLKLEPHPEGGYFRETYRSRETLPGKLLTPAREGERAVSTAIYFLLKSGQFSALHRIQSDEVWHFYAGAPLTLIQIHADGTLQTGVLGLDAPKGELPQLAVPAGTWFGARVKEENSFTLVGCTVAPGFDFRDFEMASREKLLAQFPQHRAVILELTLP